MARSTRPRHFRLVAVVTLVSTALASGRSATAALPSPTPRVAFASSDHRHIEVVDPGTGDIRKVISAGLFRAVVDPSWSPDGRRLAYGDNLAVVEPAVGELRIVDVDRYRMTTVVTLPTLFVHHVAWSPRGDRIAFSTSTVYTPVWGVFIHHQSVHVIDVDGGDHLVLGAGTDPAWSPDGTRVAFASLHDILIVDPDDLAATRTIGLPNLVESHPRWSPDGARLAFTSSGVLGSPMVMTARADGSELRTFPAITYSAPTWSPDGLEVAYDDRGLVAVDVKSGVRRRLIFDEDDGTRAPAWSASGLIAFSTDRAVEAIDPVTLQRRVLSRRSADPRLAWSA